MQQALARAAEKAEARDLWGLAIELHAAATLIADIDAFHLCVVFAADDLPMQYVLFADGETTWPGERWTPQQCPADSLALELRRTVNENVLLGRAPRGSYGAMPCQRNVEVIPSSRRNQMPRKRHLDAVLQIVAVVAFRQGGLFVGSLVVG